MHPANNYSTHLNGKIYFIGTTQYHTNECRHCSNSVMNMFSLVPDLYNASSLLVTATASNTVPPIDDRKHAMCNFRSGHNSAVGAKKHTHTSE